MVVMLQIGRGLGLCGINEGIEHGGEARMSAGVVTGGQVLVLGVELHQLLKTGAGGQRMRQIDLLGGCHPYRIHVSGCSYCSCHVPDPSRSPAMNLNLTPLELELLWRSWSEKTVDSTERLVGFASSVLASTRSSALRASTPLQDLPIPCGAYNNLRRAGYTFIEDIETLRIRDLMEIRGIGIGKARIIHDAVRLFRIRQGPKPIAGPLIDETVLAANATLPWHEPLQRVELLERSFYSMKEDRDRMAALLLQVSDLISVSAGSGQVRALAMELMNARTAVAA